MWGLSLLAFVTYITHSSCHSNQDNIHKNNHLLDRYKWRHADKVNLHSHQYLQKKSVWETRRWNNKGSQYWPSRITSSLIWMNPVQYKEIYLLFMPSRSTSSKCAWILMTTDRSFFTLIIVSKAHQLGNTVRKQYIKETHQNLSPRSKLRSSNNH